jgi:coenzyme F420-0:L-glutamate ligase / coenzyme F420-1:gamma-L-glutamate ligase
MTPSLHTLAGDRSALGFDDLVRGRRSVRKYADQPVPRALVEQVLDAARWAPSPHGRMPWRFVVLTQPGPKTQLADAMAAEWVRNLEMDVQPPEIVQLRLAKSRERIFGAPVLILPCLYLDDLDRYPDPQRQQAETTMAIQSIGASIQNLLLAAYQRGLDGGWMCAPLFCPDVVVAALDLDVRLIPQALITLGYAAADPKRRERLPLDQIVVRWD